MWGGTHCTEAKGPGNTLLPRSPFHLEGIGEGFRGSTGELGGGSVSLRTLCGREIPNAPPFQAVLWSRPPRAAVHCGRGGLPPGMLGAVVPGAAATPRRLPPPRLRLTAAPPLLGPAGGSVAEAELPGEGGETVPVPRRLWCPLRAELLRLRLEAALPPPCLSRCGRQAHPVHHC